MISLIVCSRRNHVPQALRDNVAQTIGDTPFEWIVIDNSKNLYNIFQAYNEGIRLAKGDILCFMHDDVLFHSKDWGKMVGDCFESYPKLGCLGVAGSHLMLDLPSSYWHSETFCLHCYCKDETGTPVLIEDARYKNDNGLTQVASVDGLWMCLRRSLFDTIRFDDQTFKGFHCYDSDICMQVIQAGFDIGVTFEVAVEHSKSGPLDATYFENIHLWYDKWKGFLPLSRGAEFTEDDIATRTALVRHIVTLENHVADLQRVYDSKAYRLGRVFLGKFKRKA